MHQNEYIWYSANRTKRFQRTIVSEHPRLEEYSDEGRYTLGKSVDNESARRSFIMSLPEETVEKWSGRLDEMRDKSFLRKRQLGSRHDDLETTMKTYPEKKFAYDEDYDNETQGGSDGSQPSWNEYDRSKYVLNRKINLVSMTPAQPSPHSTIENDQIFVDDRQPTTTRLVISGKENHGDKHVTSSDSASMNTSISDVSPDSTVQRPLRNAMAVTTGKGSTLIVTVHSTPEPEIQECVLNKYGHCFAPSICPFAHNGVVRKVQGKKVVAPFWQRKLPGTPICRGYLNFECWDTSCRQRHILYPSDSV